MSTEAAEPSCCAATRTGGTAAPADGAAVPRLDPQVHARLSRRLVHLPGGTFDMGSEDPDAHQEDGEGPVRAVTVAPFGIAPTAVTVAQFATFVKRTGYRTTAERLGWSYVFHNAVPAGVQVRGRLADTPWWLAVDGASWRSPEGPGSGITDRQHHPVVHVSRDDALAYCGWAGLRLPSEAEWEYAARGGLSRARYPWGDDLRPQGRHMCNIWQGTFPHRDSADDGYAGTCPVTAFPANGYGLYNMVGNVWEWSADPWDAEADTWTLRGGSHLCHDSYCNRYRVAARTHNTADSSTGNLGFRCAADGG